MTAYLTPRQAADIIGMSEKTVARLVDAGKLEATITPGGHRRIDPVDLIPWQRTRVSATVTVLTPPSSEEA
jgi:excisionase family DNA binding protein